MSARAYYNENDPFAAAWLRELIKRDLIAPGDVDERSIADVRPADLASYTQCHFFAGIGGWSYALRLAGWADDCAVWTGSCPCQPFSSSGWGQGEQDSRHLWPVWEALIRQCSPAKVFGEQVSGASGLSWLDAVCHGLEGAGYAVAAADLCASSVGAPHIRQRLFFIADRDGEGLATRNESRITGTSEAASAWRELERVHAASAWPTWVDQSGVGVFHDGLPARLVKGSIRGFGNAIVPQVAAAFIGAYMEITREPAA